jgi:hypothetical protein
MCSGSPTTLPQDSRTFFITITSKDLRKLLLEYPHDCAALSELMAAYRQGQRAHDVVTIHIAVTP